MTEEQKIIAALQKQLDDCESKIAEMEGDILTTVKTFSEVIQALGLKIEDLSGGKNVLSMLPGLVTNISFKMASPGGFEGQEFKNLGALVPVLAKYKYLTEELEF